MQIIKDGEIMASFHDDPKILSSEYTKKLDEIYEYVKNSGQLLETMTRLQNSENTINITINKDNANIDEFTKSFEQYVKNVFNNLNNR